ncbi:glycosyltransferase 87 family protein [Tsukamurella strandjordii]|uniref:glycosyltransferase 87 family protein n=1 Tax=Tsukamurella strandjordii TaxID=147577 RepID=UPI0031D89B3D
METESVVGEPGYRVSVRLMISCIAVGVTALILRYSIIPFYAPPGFGLLANGGDFYVYIAGAEKVMNGEPLYSFWFTYTPFAALLFVPWSLGNTGVLWFLLILFALGMTVWRCLRLVGYRRQWQLAVASFGITLAAIDLEAVRGSVWQGQVNILLMAIVVWDLTRPPGARLRGWSVGFAAGIKLTALIFVPYLLLTRQWRAAVTSVLTASVTVVIGFVVLPGDSRDYWLDKVLDVSRVGDVTHPANQSVNGVLANLYAPATVPFALWAACSLAVAGVAFAAARKLRTQYRETVSVCLVGLAGCAVTPLAWSHHWVWFVPIIVIMTSRALTSAGAVRRRWAIATAILVAATSMWLTVLIYEIVKAIGMTSAVGYVPAMDAAIEHIPHWARVITCGVPVLILIVISGAVLLSRPRIDPARDEAGAPMANPSP